MTLFNSADSDFGTAGPLVCRDGNPALVTNHHVAGAVGHPIFAAIDVDGNGKVDHQRFIGLVGTDLLPDNLVDLSVIDLAPWTWSGVSCTNAQYIRFPTAPDGTQEVVYPVPQYPDTRASKFSTEHVTSLADTSADSFWNTSRIFVSGGATTAKESTGIPVTPNRVTDPPGDNCDGTGYTIQLPLPINVYTSGSAVLARKSDGSTALAGLAGCSNGTDVQTVIPVTLFKPLLEGRGYVFPGIS